jgi:hypothetical protein
MVRGFCSPVIAWPGGVGIERLFGKEKPFPIPTRRGCNPSATEMRPVNGAGDVGLPIYFGISITGLRDLFDDE